MSKNPKPKGPAPFNNPFAQLKPQGASARSKGAPGKGPPKPALPPPPPPRKATLEEEERALFLEAVGEVEPVPQVETSAPTPRERTERHHDDSESLAQLAEMVAGSSALERLEEGDRLLSHVKGLDPRVVRKLRQGEFAIDGELDLHGMKRVEAQVALEAWVTRSRRAGARCLLLITGRGLHSPTGEAVLKDAVPGWLEGPRLARHLLGFCAASPKHGGPGALYVLLRK